MKYLLILIIIHFGAAVYSSVSFPTALIADSLLKNSNVVVRYDSISYKLINPGKAEMSRYKVVTILNRHGEGFAENYVLFDKNSKVTSFSGEILDAAGNRIRKIKKDEISDNSLVGSYNLFQDDRYLNFTALHPTYPYTVVAEYSVTYNGVVSINLWMPVPAYNVAVEKSVFEIVSNGVKLRFKSMNMNDLIRSETDASGNMFKWTLSNKTAIEREPYTPSETEIFPVLWSVPEVFEYEGKRGSFETWQKFGEWEWDLINKKQNLAETSKAEIRKMTENATDNREKVKILYEYLQQKTRYVSVQLGIGGWEPFPATVVDEVGYGDCKALSNYMVALLKTVNINSFYTLIGNGGQKIQFPDFPSMGQANHVIVCVPFENDTVWLECTNQKYPFGYIGKGNSGRYALLVTAEGGKLVKTPEPGKEQNLQTRNALVTIDESGNGEAIVNTSFSGLQFSNRHFLLWENKEDQKKWYLKNLSFNSPALNAFRLTESAEPEPVISEELDVFVPKSAIISGNRLFLKPNILNTFSSTPPKTNNRKFIINLDFAYTDIDSVKYTIPEGYQPESTFNNLEFDTEFGKYSAKVSIDNNNLLYVRKIEMNSGTWPPSRFEEFRSFINSVWKSDQANLVFKKN